MEAFIKASTHNDKVAKSELSKKTAMSDERQGRENLADAAGVEPLYIFIFGVFSVFVAVAISLVVQNPPHFPRVIITVLIGLGGAAIASSITGFLEVKSKWVRAGGPLGVLVFLCFFIWQAAGSSG